MDNAASVYLERTITSAIPQRMPNANRRMCCRVRVTGHVGIATSRLLDYDHHIARYQKDLDRQWNSGLARHEGHAARDTATGGLHGVHAPVSGCSDLALRTRYD